MLHPLRIIFSDTLTGETDYKDVLEPVEFNARSVQAIIHTVINPDNESPALPVEIIAWIVNGYGGTACFILQFGPDLIHGVCYTRFDASHNPLN